MVDARIIGTIWVCVCCYLSHANGECCSNDDHGGDGIEPLSAIEPGYNVTIGMGWEDHTDECLTHIVRELQDKFPDMEWPDVPDDYECDCEQNTFSRSRCEGCGSYLHGERHALTLWKD
jgi:hypothetical protein